MAKLYGSLEAGGTKFVCAVGDEKFQVVEKTQFPTTTPYETIDRTIEFFKRYEDQLAGIAIGSFGPIDVDPNSETYGFVTSTPKPHWSNVDLLGLMFLSTLRLMLTHLLMVKRLFVKVLKA